MPPESQAPGSQPDLTKAVPASNTEPQKQQHVAHHARKSRSKGRTSGTGGNSRLSLQAFSPLDVKKFRKSRNSPIAAKETNGSDKEGASPNPGRHGALGAPSSKPRRRNSVGGRSVSLEKRAKMQRSAQSSAHLGLKSTVSTPGTGRTNTQKTNTGGAKAAGSAGGSKNVYSRKIGEAKTAVVGGQTSGSVRTAASP